MRKVYKIGEVANILGVSADTIRYYEKNGIVYSHKDAANGYRYFTSADIYALLDVLFYRSMDIPVEEVCKIMNSYQHRDVKKLLEQKNLSRQGACLLEEEKYQFFVSDLAEKFTSFATAILPHASRIFIFPRSHMSVCMK